MTRYQELLKDSRWAHKRIRILDRDGWMCQYCSASTKTNRKVVLEVHHFEYSHYSVNPWDVPDEDLVTLCSDCHDSAMKAKDRDGNITGLREKSRVERRRILQYAPSPREIWDSTVLLREEDERKRIEIASECTCAGCRPVDQEEYDGRT